MAVTDSLTASQGQNIQLSCTVAGDPPPTVTWYHGNHIVPNEDSVNVALKDDNTSLTFGPVLDSHEGIYVCVVDNGVGQENDTIVLTVTGNWELRVVVNLQFPCAMLFFFGNILSLCW